MCERRALMCVAQSFRPAAVCLAIATSLAAAAGCGGGDGSSPTSPTATSPADVSACGAIGGTTLGAVGIVNGTACSPAASSVVLVNLRDKDGVPTGACSGTVIGPRAILTAAHCLTGDTAAVRIWPGSGSELLAESFHPSPLYRPGDSSESADVGIVLVAQDLNRAPLPLLVSRDARVGEQAVVAGWGKDENGNGTILRAGTSTIAAVSAGLLETRYSSATSGVCSGDSGGPLLLSGGGGWAVAGVTSATTVGGSCALGSYYFANLRNPEIASFIFGLVPNAGRR